jgi:hypothetical protein
VGAFQFLKLIFLGCYDSVMDRGSVVAAALARRDGEAAQSQSLLGRKKMQAAGGRELIPFWLL